MIPIYSSDEARNSILKRKSMVDSEVSPHIKQSIKSLFGTEIQPQEVVQKILEIYNEHLL